MAIYEKYSNINKRDPKNNALNRILNKLDKKDSNNQMLS